MALKREDGLHLKRALRALEDVHRSVKEFAKKDAVTENVVLTQAAKTVRHKAKKLRERCKALASLLGRSIEEAERGG
jgi:hypothetical protein